MRGSDHPINKSVETPWEPTQPAATIAVIHGTINRGALTGAT
jgi:hypothetical protein